MIDVLAVTSGRNVPSSRFRVRQHIPLLVDHGLDVHEAVPAIDVYRGNPLIVRGVPRSIAAASWAAARLLTRFPAVLRSRRADVVWLERAVIPGHSTFERYLGQPMVLDVDDATWLRGPRGEEQLAAAARRSVCAIAGNRHIAEHLSRWMSEIEVIPTAIDTQRFRPSSSDEESQHLVVGWTGTSSNFGYLEGVIEAVSTVLDSYDAELRIVADREPSFAVQPRRTTFFPWSEDREAEFVGRFDIGIMPLDDSEWARGKCAFKLLQYMSCGVPFVASPVGMNRELIDSGAGLGASSLRSWQEGLAALLQSSQLRHELGLAGRQEAVNVFDIGPISARLAAVLRMAATSG